MVKKLKVGDKAPVFKRQSYNAGEVDLAQLIGKQKIILIFSRYFGCPICQLDLRELLENLPDLEESGLKLIYITQSGKEVAEDFIEEEDLSFPVIFSPKEELYEEYGLGKFTLKCLAQVPGKMLKAKKEGIEHGEHEDTKTESQCPGQFIIGEDGTLIHAQKGWLDVEGLLNTLNPRSYENEDD